MSKADNRYSDPSYGTIRSDYSGISIIAYFFFIFIALSTYVFSRSVLVLFIVFLVLAILYECVFIPLVIKGSKKKYEKMIAEKRAEIRSQETEEKQIAGLFGDNKFKRQFTNKKIIDKKAAEAMAVLTNALRSSAYQEKEVNWAVVGGLASGLGGPVAGVSAAVDTMMKNAEIRKENERNQQYVNKLANDSTAQFKDALSLSADWLKDMEKLYRSNDKTITWSLDALFSQLSITTGLIEIDALTGAVTVQAAWKNTNKNSWIDGSIRGKLYTKAGKLAGCVYLSLPVGGTMAEGCNTVDQRLIGHCTEPVIKQNEYTIQYEPINLWRLIAHSDTLQFGDGTTPEEHNAQVERYEQKYLDELKKTN